MEDTIFTKIINREIPAEIIYEDERIIVIPDKFPSMEGQILVITKEQTPYAFGIPDKTYHALMDVTKRVARALDTAYETNRTCMIIEGFEVPHVHVRLYPATATELVLEPRREASESELKIVAEKCAALWTLRKGLNTRQGLGL